LADFSAVVAASRFNPKAYAPYAEFLRTALSPRDVPTVATLLPYRQLARGVLPSAAFEPGGAPPPPAEAITLMFLDRPAESRAERDAAIAAARAALADLPGATLTGLTVIGHDTEDAVRRDLPKLFGIAAALVVGYLLLHFRSLRDTLLSAAPTAFSLLCLLAVMRLAGQKLNMINLVALPLLIGIDVDYGIFLVSLARAARRDGGAAEPLVARIAAAANAVLLCAGTTVLGFGSLVTTSVPAIRSLGFVVGVGVLACLAGTLFLLAPALLAADRKRRGRGAGAGSASP
jgi:predicted RND superfamily exporter protein